MKNFSLKALGAFIFAAGLVVAGVAAPANAAALVSPSVTSSGTIANSGTNATAVVVAATTVSSSARFVITLPTGWSTSVSPGPTCNGVTVTGINITNTGCSVSAGVVTLYSSNGSSTAPLAGGTAVTVTFGVGKLTAAAARDFTIATADSSGTVIDTSTATLASASSSYTVTFDANGGTGTTAAQTASAATALTANGFTRSGYNFTGWNTAANGSGTAYADGASYAFTSSTTLYAQWSATLANTGLNPATGISLLVGGLSLALVGAEMFMIARRKALKTQK